MANIKDITGQKFDRILVLSFSHVSNHEAMWNCRCDCGKEWLVSGHNLRNGRTKSCGCYNNERAGNQLRTHGQSKTRLYRIWRNMHKRCRDNPKLKAYRWYGGKGIKVCTEWNDPQTFIEWAMNNGYAPDLTIDRIDNNKDYCPENCQWIPKAENTRRATKKQEVTP